MACLDHRSDADAFGYRGEAGVDRLDIRGVAQRSVIDDDVRSKRDLLGPRPAQRVWFAGGGNGGLVYDPDNPSRGRRYDRDRRYVLDAFE